MWNLENIQYTTKQISLRRRLLKSELKTTLNVTVRTNVKQTEPVGMKIREERMITQIKRKLQLYKQVGCKNLRAHARFVTDPQCHR